MSIAATSIGEAPIAGGPIAQPAAKVPPKRRTSAIADTQLRPEAR